MITWRETVRHRLRLVGAEGHRRIEFTRRQYLPSTIPRSRWTCDVLLDGRLIGWISARSTTPRGVRGLTVARSAASNVRRLDPVQPCRGPTRGHRTLLPLRLARVSGGEPLTG